MKLKFKYANNEEFLEAFGERLAEVRENDSNTKLTIDQTFDVYLSVAECVRVLYSEHYEEILLPDYDRQLYMSNHLFLYDVLCLVCYKFHLHVRPSISKAKQLFKEKFCDPATVRQAVPAPSYLIITKDGNIYDIRAQKYVDPDPRFYYSVSYDIDPFEKLDIASEYYKAANLVLDSWSNHSKRQAAYLRLVIYLALCGYGAESLVLLTGESGSGKSTFLTMLANLVGHQYVQVFDFCKIHDNRFLKSIDLNARMLYSYGRCNNFTFNQRATELLKALISSDKPQIETTKRCALSLTNCGLKIQEANMVPGFTLEPGESIDDRLIILNFGKTNYWDDFTVSNQLCDLAGKSISELIKDKQFLDTLRLMILQSFKLSE